MKPDGMLTTPNMIMRARKRLVKQGTAAALSEFATLEPALVDYIDHCCTLIVGKLAISGAPTELVQGVREEILQTVLTSIAALRRGHYKLWKDTALGDMLASLDPSLTAGGNEKGGTSVKPAPSSHGEAESDADQQPE